MTDDIKKDWGKIAEQEEHQEEKVDVDVNIGEEEDGEGDASGILSHPNYIELEDKLTQAEQLAHENWEKSMRAMAELDNVRRRSERDVANAHKFGIEKFVESLLPVVDSLEQALQAADRENESLQGMCEGIELTLKLFADSFAKFGVTQINPEGEVFDPQHHEAMSIQQVPDVKPNTIITVFQKGYLLNDRVVRPARVVVSKA